MQAPTPGQQLFAAIKQTARAGEPGLVLPVGQPLAAVVRPIATVPGHTDALDAQLLTDWRNRHVKSFLTEFVSTPERTAAWLAGAVHGNPGKMLFMVETLDGARVGHVGLGFIDWQRGYGEADAIVSGGASPPGLMKASLLVLMRWARDALGLQTLAVRVRSDNPAVEFYRKVGFQEYQRVPIVATNVPGGVDWNEDPAAVGAPASLVYMQLQLPAA
ncbi:aminotransferase [Acidovorax sp. Leaf76]|uniref:GNAT family N-acetyltransferase n=1 Tax=unclassified Acidovorax TaxID=2684926 RepID=UPI0006F4B7A3|nr:MULTISPECIES: GNAT family N-acetyltransferase [unclassified Acidovorax]KQO13864.1 aminotransferase [Acidovorax sp. Leaf76]KQO31384.1 aminotransferase [Acidovorax sp. Leaf84]KQS27405.1 aminotransferase [Acidovorax sp. Leaf191]